MNQSALLALTSLCATLCAASAASVSTSPPEDKLLPNYMIVYFSPEAQQQAHALLESYSFNAYIEDECRYLNFKNDLKCQKGEVIPFAIVTVPSGFVADWVAIFKRESIVTDARAITALDIVLRSTFASLETSFSTGIPSHAQKVKTALPVEGLSKIIETFIGEYYRGRGRVNMYDVGKNFSKYIISGLAGEISGDTKLPEGLQLSILTVPYDDLVTIYLVIDGHYEVTKRAPSGRVLSTAFEDFEYHPIFYKKLHDYLAILATKLERYLVGRIQRRSPG